jgi:S1-C subfamily serine protease
MTADLLDTLATISNQLADAVDTAAASVVQVQGRARPASGVVVRDDTVLTTGRAIGRENGLHVRTPDNRTLEAELAGWDPATHLAVLRVANLGVPPAAVASARARVGHITAAIARSWSNAVTATVGNVAVIGGPLPTGRGKAIDEIIRITAPMHHGFAGGLLIDTGGQALGITTAAEIRGLGVVIPAAIAWKAADEIVEQGRVTRGYLGVAGQSVQLGARQQQASGIETALLVFAVTPESPAEAAGVLVGDVITTFDGEPVESADRLLELLVGDRVGRAVSLKVLRGGAPTELSVTVGHRAG